MSVLINVSHLCLQYHAFGLFKRSEAYTALNDVSFELTKGETFGVIGRNGCGKSTLLQLLAGVIAPTSGSIISPSKEKVTTALLTLGLGFNRHLSGRDNAMLSAMLQGMSKKDAIAQLEEIKEFSELGDFFEKPVLTYSAGMRSKLGFATAITTDVDLLLIDETLSVGDQAFKKKAEKVMLDKVNSEQTVVFVSHSAEQVKRLCQRGIWLEKGKVLASGTMEEVAQHYGEFMNKVGR